MTLDELDRLAAEKVVLVIVPEHPQYAVDVFGNVWRLHNGWQTSKPKVCRPYIDKYGYPTVRLKIGKKYVAKKVHALVCCAFYGPRPLKHETRHLNGVKTDNRKENLIWGTTRENYQDKIRHGLKIFGEENHSSKLTPLIVHKIFLLRNAEWKIKDIANKFGVANETIRKVLIRKTWSHVKIPEAIVRACLKAKGVEV